MIQPLLIARNERVDLALLPALANRHGLSDLLFGRTGPRGGQQSKGMLEAMAGSASRAIGSELGRQVLRGVLGSIFGGKRK